MAIPNFSLDVLKSSNMHTSTFDASIPTILAVMQRSRFTPMFRISP